MTMHGGMDACCGNMHVRRLLAQQIAGRSPAAHRGSRHWQCPAQAGGHRSTARNARPKAWGPQNPASPFASFAGHHVGVRVPDYDAAVAWYTEKLDFRVLQEWPYGDMRLAYLSPAADDDFHLELLAGPIEHSRPVLDDLGQSLTYGGYQHFCLRVASVDKARAELAARGVDVLGEPFEIEAISRRLAFFRDPWGNMIELSETLPGAGA